MWFTNDEKGQEASESDLELQDFTYIQDKHARIRVHVCQCAAINSVHTWTYIHVCKYYYKLVQGVNYKYVAQVFTIRVVTDINKLQLCLE